MNEHELVLVIGGARSGKSDVAEKYVSTLNNKVFYIATAGIYDNEMAERVQLHRQRRPDSWVTIEEPLNLAGALKNLPTKSVVLVDCLTMWITNMILDESFGRLNAGDLEKRILQETACVIEEAQENKLRLILVSNEVGYGLVPDNELGRLFRDIAGRVNQYIAQAAEKVILVVAGIPLEIKSIAKNFSVQEGI